MGRIRTALIVLAATAAAAGGGTAIANAATTSTSSTSSSQAAQTPTGSTHRPANQPSAPRSGGGHHCPNM